MGKSLLTDSVLKKLVKLDRNISYKIGNDVIDIEVKKTRKKSWDRYTGANYKEWTIYFNDKKILYKKEGSDNGGFTQYRNEIFYFPEMYVDNDTLKGMKFKYYGEKDCFKNDIDEKGLLDIEQYNIYLNSLKKEDNYYYQEADRFVKVFYIPEKKEIGLKIGEKFKKIIDSPYKNTEEKVQNILGVYNNNSKEMYNAIIEIIENNEIGENIKFYKSNEYEKIRNDLNLLLSFDFGYATIYFYINIIEKISNIYIDKENIENHIYNFCKIVEQCLDMAANDEKEYEEELEAVKKRLRQKHNMN